MITQKISVADVKVSIAFPFFNENESSPEGVSLQQAWENIGQHGSFIPQEELGEGDVILTVSEALERDLEALMAFVKHAEEMGFLCSEGGYHEFTIPFVFIQPIEDYCKATGSHFSTVFNHIRFNKAENSLVIGLADSAFEKGFLLDGSSAKEMAEEISAQINEVVSAINTELEKVDRYACIV